MDVTTGVGDLQTYLNDRIAEPVRVSGMEDERPMPLVLVADWTITDYSYHNTARAGRADDPDDGVTKEWYLYYYDLRVELVVAEPDEVGAHTLLDDVRRALAPLTDEPTLLHDDVYEARLGGAGGIDHQFIESTETELSQTLQLRTFLTTAKSPDEYDTIDSFINDITLSQ